MAVSNGYHTIYFPNMMKIGAMPSHPAVAACEDNNTKVVHTTIIMASK
jgi:hypothetical protein